KGVANTAGGRRNHSLKPIEELIGAHLFEPELLLPAIPIAVEKMAGDQIPPPGPQPDAEFPGAGGMGIGPLRSVKNRFLQHRAGSLLCFPSVNPWSPPP